MVARMMPSPAAKWSMTGEKTALNRLSEIGQWLKLHGESIYGTDAGDFKQGEEIVTTQKDNLEYVHILTDTIKEVKIPMKDKIKNVYK